MTRIESELHDLHECLMRNDGMADRDTYRTIVGIANDVAEVEAENVKLRELARDMWCNGMCECDESGACAECEYHFPDRMRELGVEVTGDEQGDRRA